MHVAEPNGEYDPTPQVTSAAPRPVLVHALPAGHEAQEGNEEVKPVDATRPWFVVYCWSVYVPAAQAIGAATPTGQNDPSGHGLQSPCLTPVSRSR